MNDSPVKRGQRPQMQPIPLHLRGNSVTEGMLIAGK